MIKNAIFTPEREQLAADTLFALSNISEPETVFAHSYGAEDMVIMDLLAKNRASTAHIQLFSLDTGRLPAETYTLMQTAQAFYADYFAAKNIVKLYFPESQNVENLVATQGINGFYDSVDARKNCCFVRKVQPLQRALAGKQAWITGLRRAQAVSRTDLPPKEWDEAHQLWKYNPLAAWSEADVWAYLLHYGVPFSALHKQNYPSIGCAPCTRGVAMGEDVRAGRWWWENPENKECGLHLK